MCLAESGLILASRSPRRAALLKQAGFRFQIMTRPVNEENVSGLSPREHVQQLSRRKAEAVFQHMKSGTVIGADTIVHIGGRILGKPLDAEEAFGMLSLLSGRTHQVYTGLTLQEAGGVSISRTVCTDVTFRNLSEWEIKAYIDTGGPMDKAGAYGIQERACIFVSDIQGCYYNVVGFPLSEFMNMLKQIWDEEKIRRHLF
ncbi:septum formation protein Maf [bacterium]|nr:septum formation protein Maf [bacterium]